MFIQYASTYIHITVIWVLRAYVAELKYAIPKQFKYHTQKSKDVLVDLYRFSTRR